MYEMLASLCRGVRSHHSRCERLFGAFAFLMLLPGPLLGYELDFHYYLRFGLSL